MVQCIKNPTSVCEDEGLITASLSRLRIWHCHKLQHRSKMQLGSGIAVAVARAGSCSSDMTPSLGISNMPMNEALKKKKRMWKYSLEISR